MSFAWPWALLGIAAGPAIAAAVWWARRRRLPAALPHPDLDLISSITVPPRRRRFVPALLMGLALAAFSVGLARPQTTRQVPKEQATIMLAIDVSGSMAAADVSPYRLRAAQDAAKRFADLVPRQYQIGLVSFAGEATLIVPPTTDRPALEDGIESLVPVGDTAIGDAVIASLDAIRQTQPGETKLRSARVLLLSDGSNRTGASLEEAARQANSLGVPVFTVALGTEDGITPDGQPVPPDPAALGQLATDTKGRTFESKDASSLNAVYERLGTIVGTDSVPAESTAWWALLGALLVAGAGAAAWLTGRRAW